MQEVRQVPKYSNTWRVEFYLGSGIDWWEKCGVLISSIEMACTILCLLAVVISSCAATLTFHQGGYNHLQVALAPQTAMPANCSQMLNQMEVKFFFVLNQQQLTTYKFKRGLAIDEISAADWHKADLSRDDNLVIFFWKKKREKVFGRRWNGSLLDIKPLGYLLFHVLGRPRVKKLFPPVRILKFFLATLTSIEGGGEHAKEQHIKRRV